MVFNIELRLGISISINRGILYSNGLETREFVLDLEKVFCGTGTGTNSCDQLASGLTSGTSDAS